MENRNIEILFKILWVGLTLFTIYMFGWLTFIYLTFGSILLEEYNNWNLLIPNILSIGLLIIYTKEILIGYNPKSKNRNLKSLLVFSILIITLTLIQVQQFGLLFDEYKSNYWQIILPLIMVLASYIGIMMNRILRIKKYKSERITAQNRVRE